MTQEQKSSTETVSKETVNQEILGQSGETTQKTEPVEQSQFLTKEEAKALLTEALEQGKKIGWSETQASKDRQIAEHKRRADLAERSSIAFEQGLGELDEETRARLVQRRLKGENEYYKTREQEEEARRQQEIYIAQLDQSLRDEVTSLGFDPLDKRVDYAIDATSYFEGRKRFSDSLAKIVKAEKESAARTALDKAEERFKQLEAEFRKQHGLDSQDTTSQTGVVNQSDADFMAAWGSYKLPDTKENRARYEEIKEKYY